MRYTFQFRKLCNFDAKRLVWMVGVIVAVLVVQSAVLPDSNIFSSVFSYGKISLLGRSDSLTRDAVPESVVNNSSTKGSSLTPILDVMNDTATLNIAKRDTSAPVDSSGNKNGSSAVVEVEMNNTSEKVAYRSLGKSLAQWIAPVPEPSHFMERSDDFSGDIVSDNAGKKENSFSSENFEATSPALPPVYSSIGNRFPGAFEVNSSSSFSLVNLNAPSAKKRESGKPDNKSNGDLISGSPKSSISMMNNLLLKNRASFHSMKPQMSSVRDKELEYAKFEIENAAAINGEVALYPSVFRNVSMFKRSYELMERILKIYIYSEGEKPIFHEATEPILQGIYSSEGWFIRSMEKNNQFVVKDPSKAHLFFIPFSSRMLQLTLYKRKSHSRSNLAVYMKKYVEVIAAKHPFWNRTGGEDHFVVACHDWAPFEVRGRMDHCIKVLCNANAARDFRIGKDVTLPETQVRKMEDPLRYLGGKPPLERQHLAFFAGGMHGNLRPVLLKLYGNNQDPDMNFFGKMNRKTYIEYMKSSKYCICARGYDVNSPRVFEALFFDCVPVFVADNYVPPFFEVLNWEKFAVFVEEKDMPKLKEILLSISDEKYLKMQKSVKKVQQHFLWHTNPVKYDIFHMILHSVWFSRINEI